jgi:hypothetical protein
MENFFIFAGKISPRQQAILFRIYRKSFFFQLKQKHKNKFYFQNNIFYVDFYQHHGLRIFAQTTLKINFLLIAVAETFEQKCSIASDSI